MNRSPNDQRNRSSVRILKANKIVFWNNLLESIIKQVFNRQITLKDYTLFHKEKRFCRSNYELYYDRKSIGFVKDNKFISNHDI